MYGGIEMVENEVMEKQLLMRAMQNKDIAVNILSKGISTLLTTKVDQTLAFILVKYYNQNSIPMSHELLKSRLTESLNRENGKRERLNQSVLTDTEEVAYYTRVDDLYQDKPDTSEAMSEDLDSYVKDTLTTKAILEEAEQGTNQLAQRVSKRVNEINEVSLSHKVNDALDVFQDLDKRKELYQDATLNDKVSFGIPDLDNVTRGGLKRGQIGLIGAMSGNGKTTTLSNISYQFMAHGYHVVHISLEELVTDQMVRFDRLIGNASVENVYNPNGTIKQDFIDKMDKFLNGAKSHFKGTLQYIASSPNTLTVDGIKQLLIEYERKSSIKVDALVLDYADLLKKGANSFGHEAEYGERLFQDLVKLAQEQHIVIMTGTQLNRSSSISDTKTLQSIEGSYRKINTIALGLTINTSSQEYNEGYVRLYLDKVRNNYGYDDDFIYLKWNTKNMKLMPETDDEKQYHKSIVGNDSSTNYEVKKDDKNQHMEDAINKTVDTINKAFSI